MPRRDASKARSDWTTGYKIPENITPTAFREFCFRLPDEPAYIDAFWQHIDKLGIWHAWEHPVKSGGKDFRAKDTANFWAQHVYQPNRDAFEMGQGCGCPDETEPVENDCTSYAPLEAFLKFLPTSPYDGRNSISPGYSVNPWAVSKGDTILGLQAGDVYATAEMFFEGVNALNFTPKMIERFVNGGFPRFEFTFTGKGEVELHLLTVPQGGFYLIRDKEGQVEPQLLVGSSVDLGDFDDWIDALVTLLGLGVEGKLFPERIIELEFTRSGKHTIEVMLLPRIGFPNVLETGFGGGIREIVVCGKHAVIATPPPPIIEIREGEIVYLDKFKEVFIPVPGSAVILESYCECEEEETEEDCEEC